MQFASKRVACNMLVDLFAGDLGQANIDASLPQEEWNLEALCAKVKQYCYLLEDLSPELLADKCSTIESLSDYLHFRGREAYLQKKVKSLSSCSFSSPPASNGFFPKTRAAQQLCQQVNSVHHAVF
jgi:hypothetical protein